MISSKLNILRPSSKNQSENDRTSRVLHSLSLIEDVLEPLILYTMTPNTNQACSPGSKIKVHDLVKALVDSTDDFIFSTSEIFKNYKEINSEIIIEIENLRAKSKRYFNVYL